MTSPPVSCPPVITGGVHDSAPAGEAGAVGAAAVTGGARPLLDIIAIGKPAPQGSKTKSRWGAIYDDNQATLRPWRDTVTVAAIDVMSGGDRSRHSPLPVTSSVAVPVAVDVVFTFAKPESAPKRRRVWPTRKSTFDVDKLARACLDALTDAGAWKDDSQVIDLRARKVFVGEDPQALLLPGARIRVYLVAGP